VFFVKKGYTCPLVYADAGLTASKNTARLMLYAKFIPQISLSALSIPIVFIFHVPGLKPSPSGEQLSA